MKLPHAERAIISEEKLVHYLLNLEHTRGGSKAAVLLAFGYTRDDWQQLALDLRQFHLPADVLTTRTTPYGQRYEIRAAITTPNSKQLIIRSVWQIDTGTTEPRLLTLFPD